jgi:hypothetical protein
VQRYRSAFFPRIRILGFFMQCCGSDMIFFSDSDPDPA